MGDTVVDRNFSVVQIHASTGLEPPGFSLFYFQDGDVRDEQVSKGIAQVEWGSDCGG
jgi:hypothetical protein